MKKIILSALAIVFALNVANAQEVITVTSTNYFKPEQGNVTADLGLFSNGITSAPISKLSGMLQGRYFLADDMALRASFTLRNATNTDTSNPSVTVTNSNSGFNLYAGIEKHFEGTDRLSPYVGAELGIETSSSKQVTDYKDNTVNQDITVKTPSQFYFGGNLLFGADYYVAQHLYIGAEAGLSIGTNFIGRSVTTIGGNSTQSEPGGTNFTVGTNIFAGFKVGFVF